MQGYPFYKYHPYHRTIYPHPGLMGVFGGIINLTTTALQGGARVVRTIVEGSAWYGCPHGYPDCSCYSPCHPMHHCYHIKCMPQTFPCCQCCCC